MLSGQERKNLCSKHLLQILWLPSHISSVWHIFPFCAWQLSRSTFTEQQMLAPDGQSYPSLFTPPASVHSLSLSQENPASTQAIKLDPPVEVPSVRRGQAEYNKNAVSLMLLLFQHPWLVCMPNKYDFVLSISLNDEELLLNESIAKLVS